jgi:hypothetical protein
MEAENDNTIMEYERSYSVASRSDYLSEYENKGGKPLIKE